MARSLSCLSGRRRVTSALGVGVLASSLALAGCSNKGAKGGGTIPPVNSASAGSRSTASSVASGGAASADAVTADPLVDGATLAQAAWNAIKLLTPTVETNPKVGDRGTTLVGMDAWVWATASIPRTVTATATAGPTAATASGLQLSAPDGRASCQGFGVVWHSGMADRVESVHDLPVQCAPRWFDTVDGVGGLKPDVFGV